MLKHEDNELNLELEFSRLKEQKKLSINCCNKMWYKITYFQKK